MFLLGIQGTVVKEEIERENRDPKNVELEEEEANVEEGGEWKKKNKCFEFSELALSKQPAGVY